MSSPKLIVLVGTFVLLSQITVLTVSGANVATTSASSTAAPQSTTIPSTVSVKGAAQLNASKSSTVSSSHASHVDDEDCSDEVPEPEPEGKSNGTSTGDNRQGKQITLGSDKDKYTHENGTAEPEPEQSANDKLTGSNSSTTDTPDHGSASGKEGITYGVVLGIAFTVYFRSSF